MSTKVCYECSTTIVGKYFVTKKGNAFHEICFKCLCCQTALTGSYVSVERFNREEIYCSDHAEYAVSEEAEKNSKKREEERKRELEKKADKLLNMSYVGVRIDFLLDANFFTK